MLVALAAVGVALVAAAVDVALVAAAVDVALVAAAVDVALAAAAVGVALAAAAVGVALAAAVAVGVAALHERERIAPGPNSWKKKFAFQGVAAACRGLAAGAAVVAQAQRAPARAGR